ncbi:hypothetical protein J2W91_003606 [Paenibacillus amylolyticus]|uniref:Uncharacterized protein n=1 Tax=Paenibacillus amylolyticus TaxID=1451 RepID=A0AAP5LMZ7_PAEAM|nr:hypothetical protein [Paenibacillus amylolyticus]
MGNTRLLHVQSQTHCTPTHPRMQPEATLSPSPIQTILSVLELHQISHLPQQTGHGLCT